MSYLDHINICNTHDLSKFVVLCDLDGERVGWIRKDNVSHLKSYDDVFDFREDKVILRRHDDVSAALAAVTKDLHDKGIIKGWRDELYGVAKRFMDTPKFVIERASTPFFGMRSFGVHINGFVRGEDGLKMWVGKRATDRAISPGKLDNMVAGGQPAGLSLQDNIVKECAEEANIPKEIAQQAVPVGTVEYMMETDGGIKPDVMFCYDLELPHDFTPVNTDGETEEFYLMPIQKVADIVNTGSDFKFNCNLVVIDFLIRHGVLNPDTTADYEAIVKGLRS